MAGIWTLENKYRRWLEVEIAVCAAWEKLGRIPEGTAASIESKARVDAERCLEIEAELHHDLLAFVRQVTETLGDEGKYLHYGVTSYDIEDTALALMLRESADILVRAAGGLRTAIGEQAKRHKQTVMMGRTHGVHAEPTTFGAKLAVWQDEMARHIERLERARQRISFGKVSAAVGTFANVPPDVEAQVCARLGLEPAPVSTQILQRDRHAEFVSALALVASSIEKFAMEIRNLAGTEIGEVEEAFGTKQRGSSAMPHKENPRLSEQMTGLARVMRSYAGAALQNVPLWHERDLSNSSAERIIIPDACTLLDYMLATMKTIVEGLVVHKEKMEENLGLLKGVTFSQQVLLSLVESGFTREEAYDIVQSDAMAALDRGTEFREVLHSDERLAGRVPLKSIDACFDLAAHTRYVDEIMKRVGLEE
jgi:adenylosuccinate lyase